MSAGDVVCTGWLIKSPPEKKLKRYAWRKRWFVLRQGRMSGNPDVLEYYRGKSSKKPIRTIDLRECQVQRHEEVRLIKREFQHLFIVKTSSRIFYLVAKTEEEMNSWVRNISQICHFGSLDDEADLDSFSQQPSPTSSSHTSRVTGHELSTEANTTEDSRSNSESSLPPDYLILSQCETGRVSITSCSNSERSLEQNSSDIEDVFLSPHLTSQTVSPFLSVGPSEPPLGTPSTPLERLSEFSSSCSSTSPTQMLPPTPDIFQFEPVSSLSPEGSMDGHAPPPRPPKPSRFSERRVDNSLNHMTLRDGEGLFTLQPAPNHRRISLSGLEHDRKGEFDNTSVRSWSKRLSLNLPQLTPAYSPNSADCYEDSYIPMTSPPISTVNNESDGYIPMSPTSVKFLLSNGKPEPPPPAPLRGLPCDLEPPPVNRDLKPRRRARPPPLDLRGLSTISECPLHLSLTRTLTEPGNSTHWFSLERGPGIGGASEDEEDWLSGESKQLLPPNGNTTLCFPKKSNLDYLSLDFNPASPSPVQKKALLTDEHRVDYVQVDEKKTQALQNTKMEWKDVRQSKV
ncbi:GRB2-associated-binding protein 3-like isoform X1 [Megalops cyprinoides]|uniref:GRB2-associated-binding protein 3-like isoform X1 n=1 Tax=Megalops cyprinoides TaxID=118141 RepID=UPI001863FBC2|nr:GRB2-associated-binding protein 3-like isoform X1 [Megalops cyprinoides]